MEEDETSDFQQRSIHNLRNRLNRITMQTELAKMLVDKGADAETITAALDKSLLACEELNEQLRAFTK